MANLWKAKVERRLWKLAHPDKVKQYARVYRRRNYFRLKDKSRIRMKRSRDRRRLFLLQLVAAAMTPAQLTKYRELAESEMTGAQRAQIPASPQVHSRSAPLPSAHKNGAIVSPVRKPAHPILEARKKRPSLSNFLRNL